MPYRPLNDTERLEIERKIREVEEKMAPQQRYILELKDTLIKGIWETGLTDEDYELVRLEAEYYIVQFDQWEQERGINEHMANLLS